MTLRPPRNFNPSQTNETGLGILEYEMMSERASTLGHHGEIPRQLAISFTGARELRPAQGRGAIRFFADGASSGGRIELQARQATWRVEVAWITGEVSSGRVERSP